jgi:hypothetical protein
MPGQYAPGNLIESSNFLESFRHSQFIIARAGLGLDVRANNSRCAVLPSGDIFLSEPTGNSRKRSRSVLARA